MQAEEQLQESFFAHIPTAGVIPPAVSQVKQNEQYIVTSLADLETRTVLCFILVSFKTVYERADCHPGSYANNIVRVGSREHPVCSAIGARTV